MYAPAFGRSPARDGVAFDEEGPHLIVRHDDDDDDNSGRADAVVEEVVVHAGKEEEDADDSVAMVFSADTGAGRAHTPQRLNRTNTPQRYECDTVREHTIRNDPNSKPFESDFRQQHAARTCTYGITVGSQQSRCTCQSV